ncbi:hypothetical protein IWW50_006218, partial [Coemansia erecta]
MNIDTPNEYQPASPYGSAQQSISTFQQQQQPHVSGRGSDYYAYSTTTAQMVDPWAFNHANLLANLSQLPPDLLPTLLPQIQQQQQNAPNMSALAAAAAVAAASGVVPMNTQQQQQQHQMHADRPFAVPAVPLHRQQTSVTANTPSNVVLPSLSNFSQSTRPPGMPPQQGSDQRYEYIDPANSARQQQLPAVPPQYAQPGAYSGNMYYANSSLQPLMLPPPSPTILSYYTADPTQWMSLLGQNAYQPQAYHYDYPLPPHQLPFNFP